MFKQLTDKITSITDSIRGIGTITESKIATILTDIKDSLIEADINTNVANAIVDDLKREVLGQKITKQVKPHELLQHELHKQITKALGEQANLISVKAKPPAVILMCGIQGSGKTSTVAKIAHKLAKAKKSVVTCSCDIYRPGAIKQLATLAETANTFEFFTTDEQKPIKIATDAIAYSKKQMADVLIIDTAGRSEVDTDLLKELKEIYLKTNPVETILVGDSMLGQKAASIALTFSNVVPLTGVILTKVDSDSKGGAALSMISVAKVPIKGIATGEKVDDFEDLIPKDFASKILGQGDLSYLINEAKKQKIKPVKRKLNLNDFLSQLQQLEKMGGIGKLVSKLPGGNKISNSHLASGANAMSRYKYIIHSMTKKERLNPDILNASRRKRIAIGSGTTVNDINQLINHLKSMDKFSKKSFSGKKGMMSRFW